MENGIESPQFKKKEDYKPGDKVLTDEQIEAGIKAIAPQIAEKYRGKRVFLLGVMIGGFRTAFDLLEELHLLGLTDVELGSIEVSSYGSETKSSGTITLKKDVGDEVEGRDVLVVDDVIETGGSLEYVVSRVKAKNPASVASFALVKKEGLNGIEADWTVFRIPDVWIQGRGMDSKGIGRGDRNIIVGHWNYGNPEPQELQKQ